MKLGRKDLSLFEGHVMENLISQKLIIMAIVAKDWNPYFEAT